LPLSFDHRKGWIVEKLAELCAIFAWDVVDSSPCSPLRIGPIRVDVLLSSFFHCP
jgi:hypothetical protein